MSKGSEIDELRDIVRELAATGDDGFEGLMAAVLTDVTKTSFTLAKSGSQRGKDGQSALDAGTICFEGKCYDSTVPKNEVITKITEIAIDDKGNTDLWVLGSTGPVRSQDIDTITAVGKRFGIATLILDWNNSGLSGLATLLAMAPDVSARFLAVKAKTDETQVRRKLEAVRAHAQYSDRAHEVASALEQPTYGPAYALGKNADYLEHAFAHSDRARATFGQPLAPADKSVRGILDRKALREELARHAFTKPDGSSVAILGADGNGKSWLFAQAWLNQPSRPLTVFVIPEDVKEPVTLVTAETLLVSSLIAQTNDADTEVTRARWRKHFDRWKRNRDPDRLRLVLYIDGLNQRETLQWPKALNVFNRVVTDLGGRLIFSCRTPFYRNVLLNRLLDRVNAIDVPQWTNPELENLLQSRGIAITKLNRQVVEFLRNPRILAIALNLFEQKRIEEFGALSVSRLLFEHILAGASPVAGPLPVGKFIRGVQDHADEIIERIRSHASADLSIFTRTIGPTKSSLSLEDQLRVVSEGAFFEEVIGDSTLYTVKDDSLPLALGLALLGTAKRAARNGQDIYQELWKILDPISALDDTSEVLISALIAACLQDDTPTKATAALATSLVALQNLDKAHFAEFRALVRNTPEAFLVAFEDATLSEGVTANLSWLTSALFECRDEPKCWSAILNAARRWLSMFSMTPERQIHVHDRPGSEKYAEEHAKCKATLDEQVAARSPAENALFATMVWEDRGDYSKLNRAAFKLLSARPLRGLTEEFRNWSLAASFNGGFYDAYDEFLHLLQFNRVDWQETRAGLLKAAEQLRAPETSKCGRWALVRILHATACSQGAKEAATIVEELTRDREKTGRWRIVEKWCTTDPCDPNSSKPDNIVATAENYRKIDVSTLRTHLGPGREDYFFEGARPGLVRFEPDAASATMRRFAVDVAARETQHFRPAAFMLEGHTAALDNVVAAEFLAKGDAIAAEVLTGNDKHGEGFVASQHALMIAFPHMTGCEQLARLMSYPKVKDILISLCELFDDADAPSFERFLEDAYADGDTINQFRLMVFAQYTCTPITARSMSIIGELASSTDDLVRLCALGAARRIDDDELLRIVAESGWTAATLDSPSARFEIWYGSQVLVRAAAKNLLPISDCFERIGFDAYQNLIEIAGREAATLVVSRIESALKMAAGYGIHVALPEIEQRVDGRDRPNVYGVEDRKDDNGSVRDNFKRAAETNASWFERYQRNLDTVQRFERDLTLAGANLILQAVTPDLVTDLFTYVPDAIRDWFATFAGMDERTLSRVRSLAVPVAKVLAAEDPAAAVSLFQRLERTDPFIRFTVGIADLSLDAVTVWKAADSSAMTTLRHWRLDGSRNDHELAMEVLAALHAGKTEALREYVLNRRSRAEPAHVARAIMVAGFSDDEPWALETVDAHKDDHGFLSVAYDAAKFAMERWQWSKHWAREMRRATTPTEMWRFAVLLAATVDGRFDGNAVRSEANQKLLERYGPTFNDNIKSRIKKWKGKREKKLFGEEAPDEIYLAHPLDGPQLKSELRFSVSV